MNEYATLVSLGVGFLFTWTVTVISLVIWLTGKFRDLEKLIYREMNRHREDDERQFRSLGTEVQRLKIKVFGFTGPVLNGDGIVSQ